MNKVYIYVEGGNVHVVKAEQNVLVTIIDADNLLAEGLSDKQITEKWDELTKDTVVVY